MRTPTDRAPEQPRTTPPHPRARTQGAWATSAQRRHERTGTWYGRRVSTWVRCGGRGFLLLVLFVALVRASPRGAAVAALPPDEVVTQRGAAFHQGLPVNVVTTHGVQIRTTIAIPSLLPPYARYGSYTSTPVDAAYPFRLLRLDMRAVVPSHSLILAAVRTALHAGPWSPWQDLGPVPPAVLQGATATRWQYRLSLFAPASGTGPRVEQVTVRTRPLPPGFGVRAAPIVGASYQVFATREGLVGHTTTNGHQIRPHDHFVALPSDTVLACAGCHDYTVTLRYHGRTTTAPVWDVGPWNTTDAYWNAPPTPFRSLPQGVPQAQAAYQKGYHNGQDAFSRTVSNPAGIDLADGVFSDDLHMTQDDWVTVTFNWQTRQPAAVPSLAAPRQPYAAAWLHDRYEDAPLRVLTLTTGTRSDQITVWFRNLGTATWNTHTVLALYNPRDPTAPPAASPFCNVRGPDGQPDWASCDPGILAYVGNGRPAGPGQSVPFVFYLNAPATVGDTTLYLKLAQETAGRYHWINQPNGQEANDALRVHVIPLSSNTPAASTTSTAQVTPTPSTTPGATAIVPVSGTLGLPATVTATATTLP